MKFVAAIACLSLGLAGAWAHAQNYPTKPVHLVVPFVPGGGNDLVGRVIAARLAKSLGQPFLVENRGGANGFIGAKAVADAAPDGYTILMGPSGPMAISPAIYSKMPYSPAKAFVPVTMIGDFPLILVVSGSNPAHSVAELVAYAKAHAAEINYGSTAATFQLTTELFKLRTNTKFQQILYKGSNEMAAAVMTDQVTIGFVDPPPAIGMLKSGKIRALAVTGAKRHAFWPDVPTMAEAGIQDMEVKIWMGLFLPTGSPQPIVQRLYQEVANGVNDPQVRERLLGLGIEPVGSSPEEFAKFFAADSARWAMVAKTANIKAD